MKMTGTRGLKEQCGGVDRRDSGRTVSQWMRTFSYAAHRDEYWLALLLLQHEDIHLFYLRKTLSASRVVL